ncbi:hypothetical protein [Sphaerisporangium sp. TRM90804]|uniref:hypothetical protein n=1 Tax=Sphaerisporangium sp. TRM90804 TaxID=3031113 RepID=UPI002446F3F3|nr:hypothetical protein [Sphaerisporangium sp. TRM90804]MDH2424778.1 hypothetical protein [Sphaerisporangium sp. TRM90804]
MNTLNAVTLLVLSLCIPLGIYIARRLRANDRLIDVVEAQQRRETAHHALGAAYRTEADPAAAKAAVAEAQEAVRKAEARLPVGRWTREYFASKEAS